MAESGCAKGMVQEFKVGRTRKAEEDAMLLEDKQEGIAFELRTDGQELSTLGDLDMLWRVVTKLWVGKSNLKQC